MYLATTTETGWELTGGNAWKDFKYAVEPLFHCWWLHRGMDIPHGALRNDLVLRSSRVARQAGFQWRSKPHTNS